MNYDPNFKRITDEEWSTYQTNLPKVLVQLRKACGISQLEVADYLKIQPRAVWNHENGQCLPNYRTILDYASFYQMSESELRDLCIHMERFQNHHRITLELTVEVGEKITQFVHEYQFWKEKIQYCYKASITISPKNEYPLERRDTES